MEKLDVLFLGGLFPPELEEEIIENTKGNLQNAANNLQWELIKGLDEVLEKPPKIINSIYIGSFPKRYKKIKINSFEFSHFSESKKDINVGFINLPMIKIFSKYRSMKPHIKKWIMNGNGDKKIIIAYAMTFTFTELLKYAKFVSKDVVTCLIVPDLPQFMNLSSKQNILYKILKSVEIKRINLNMNYIDSYVLLTEHMKEALNIDVPYIVVEGISPNLSKERKNISHDSGIRSILYTGGLEEKYGVIDLVKAFEKLEDDNLRLIICGSGEAESIIREASNRDSRIIFKGLLKRADVLQLQKSSTILINPRSNNGEYTKYSFPSKILEYMSSGTPVVAYMLDGMPKEYAEYIYTIDKEEGIYQKLNEVLLKEDGELRIKGKEAELFVTSKKNNKVQVEKVISMIKNL